MRIDCAITEHHRGTISARSSAQSRLSRRQKPKMGCANTLATLAMSERIPLLNRSSGGEIGFLTSFVNALKSTPISALLIFVPLGIAAEYAHWKNEVVFAFNFLAIIPLAKLLAVSTEELSIRTGPAIGGLLNATFGNFTELVCIRLS